MGQPFSAQIALLGVMLSSSTGATLTQAVIGVGVVIRAYEFRFVGEADRTVCAAFPEFDITVEDGTTLLRAELVDQAAVHGTLDRINAFGLELLEVRAVE